MLISRGYEFLKGIKRRPKDIRLVHGEVPLKMTVRDALGERAVRSVDLNGIIKCESENSETE